MAILILTQRLDVTADPVIKELSDRGAEVMRCDPGDFPTSLSLEAKFRDRWTGTLTDSHRSVRLEDLTAVYHRRPSPFGFDSNMTETEASWAEAEARYGFGGVFASLSVCWVNHPHANARAEYKPYQLAVAARAGLATLDTLVTNVPTAASSFVGEHNTGAVYKPLSGSPALAGFAHFTKPVTPSMSPDPAVAATAHLFQQRIQEKAYEVRLTVVGSHLFATRIDADSEAGRQDWRSDYDSLTYSVISTPERVKQGVAELMRQLGLRFAALDFIVTADGTWWFLEVNPNGQWGFIEHHTGHPIANAIATELLKGVSS